MAFHSFEIKHNGTAFAIRIEPANETILAVYLRYGKRPNETHYDYKFLIPDFSSCLPPTDENCTIVNNFMQCVGRENVTYKSVNFTKPGLPKSCAPQGDDVPPPAPPEEGEEAVSFKCPDICKYENTTYTNCSCDEIPDIKFLFNSTMGENNQICKAFIDFSLCENETLLCKNSVNVLNCYALQLERFKQCRTILTSPPKLFYGIYGKCLKDPFRVFFNSSVGKAGKWYAGVQYYVPPNDTTTEEEKPVKKSHRYWDWIYNNYWWWRKMTEMTNDDEVESFLKKVVLDYVNDQREKWGFNPVEFDHKRCRWPAWKKKDRVKCEEKVEQRLDLWYQWYEWYYEEEYHNDDDNDDDDGRRKRRSLPLDSKETLDSEEQKAAQLCVVVQEKPPPPRIGETLHLIEEPELDLNVSTFYSFDVDLYTCLFWDEHNNEWSTGGCTVRHVYK